MAIPSPCDRNCCLDDQDICIGCGRTLKEILRWGDADDAEKRDILLASEKRKALRKLKFER